MTCRFPTLFTSGHKTPRMYRHGRVLGGATGEGRRRRRGSEGHDRAFNRCVRSTCSACKTTYSRVAHLSACSLFPRFVRPRPFARESRMSDPRAPCAAVLAQALVVKWGPCWRLGTRRKPRHGYTSSTMRGSLHFQMLYLGRSSLILRGSGGNGSANTRGGG
jgi:hypothetical protein